MNRYFQPLALLLVLFSCSSKPKVTLETSKSSKPGWIYRQPSDDNYWYGIGISSLKIEDPRQAARQRAFSEIAEQLQVNINSNLTDVMQATDNDFSEYSKSLIETRVDASLEYVENIDSYQDETKQYVLARLDKVKYFDKINQTKKEAISKARNLINNSTKDMSANSLSNISLAIETVSPFLDLFPTMLDPVSQDKEELVTVIAERLIREYNDNIVLQFTPSSLESMSFVSDDTKIKIVSLNKKTGKSISNIRINTSFNDQQIGNVMLTDDDGKVNYFLERLKAKAGAHSIIFSLDYESMMSKQALSMVKVVPKQYPLEIKINAPKIYINSSILNLDKKVTNSSILSSLRECIESKYSSTFVRSKEKADLILKLNIYTEGRAARLGKNYPYFIYALGSIQFVDRITGEQVFTSTFEDSKGSDFTSQEKAGLNALKKLSKNLNIDICN